MARGKSLEEKRAELDRKIEQRNRSTALRSELDAAKVLLRDKNWHALATLAMCIRKDAESLMRLDAGAEDETGEQPER